MQNIAVLYTCHNRKKKTIRSLVSLKNAIVAQNEIINVTIYLTDDGSSDGTAAAVREQFPEVIVLKGNGDLFWAGGMINSWKAALNKGHQGYLLLNDDTYITENIFEDIKITNIHSLKTYGEEGVYIGSTKNPNSEEFTYGGAILTNRFLYQFKFLKPDGTFQPCDLGNANIMYVAATVVEKVGILSKGYVHGIADYDYTLKCKKRKIPVLVMPNYCGKCERDTKWLYQGFESMSFKQRVKHLHSPTGIAFKSRLLFMRKFFPYRYPFFYLTGWFKVLFPKLYVTARHGKP